ncbi:MAG: hypothetical protein ACE5K1_06250 [Acidiferrobacterales bacterium]
MDFTERAQSAAKTVCAMLHTTPSTDLERQVTEVIERTLIDAVLEDGERCARVAMECCSADQDLAHKIAEEIRRRQTALVANLSSMR